MNHSWRSFAIVPAAGQSVRMGLPKLLLPWRGRTVIEHMLAAWRTAGTTRTIVVARPDDLKLAEFSRLAGAEVIIPPVAPPEMKDSIRIAIEYLAQYERPCDEDVWLLAPADMPWLSVDVIRQLLAAHEPLNPRILVPVHHDQRGHPVLFPWTLARDVATLADDEGVNSLLKRHGWTPVTVAAADIHGDLDTPEDYDRLQTS